MALPAWVEVADVKIKIGVVLASEVVVDVDVTITSTLVVVSSTVVVAVFTTTVVDVVVTATGIVVVEDADVVVVPGWLGRITLRVAVAPHSDKGVPLGQQPAFVQ